MRGEIPGSAFVLGWAGVIPFVAFTGATIAGLPLPVSPAALLTGYGAAILSFMGGAQWGLAMSSAAGRWRGYAVSVLPALLAWCTLFVPARIALAMLALGFAGLLAYDLWTVRRGEAPTWYARLRGQLTTAVILSLVAAAVSGRSSDVP